MNNYKGWAHTHTDRAIHQDIKERARFMRQNPTRAERILWRRLRGKQIGGFRFRRQHPINRFIVDFYCAEARLVVEVDGSVHNEPGHAEYDEDRQRFLQTLGLTVLHFSNAQALRKTDAVVEAIAEAVRAQRGG
ncbi:MAG: endonuclease domain-containing protein [Chloroflexi bacterium]|nr:endonuclease domain-containing protein [Chloroflexota bacterium]